ncbi:ribonuclease HII [Alteromonas pelagimontana]|uniref:Ribonuclease HII n=1 Tax=Alteromonas pelagimontana TaxID=1858656 RepID=A0A6M4MF47_9ALTE|nr:ribonuclease HII [Alteromonas pelagimontana]QJR81784.1 ribonuclease HII [Alteromonas pelagimontana]
MNEWIAGVDEVGRGPLVGDVVTAAVILDPRKTILGLTDSKKLSAKKRELLAVQIKETAIAWAIGRATPDEIDKLNILHATMLAMSRAVEGLAVTPSWVRVDGNRLPVWSYPGEAVVKGDSLHAEISAASILAKVERDNDMFVLHEAYPYYGFAGHKGYPTKAHFAAIAEHGVLPCYRKSFKPVQAVIAQHAIKE